MNSIRNASININITLMIPYIILNLLQVLTVILTATKKRTTNYFQTPDRGAESWKTKIAVGYTSVKSILFGGWHKWRYYKKEISIVIP